MVENSCCTSHSLCFLPTRDLHRWKILNPASMKQALVEGAVRLPELNLYEQVSVKAVDGQWHCLEQLGWTGWTCSSGGSGQVG